MIKGEYPNTSRKIVLINGRVRNRVSNKTTNENNSLRFFNFLNQIINDYIIPFLLGLILDCFYLKLGQLSCE